MLTKQRLLVGLVVGALLLPGCAKQPNPNPNPNPPATNGSGTKTPQNPELVKPFNDALEALKRLNVAGEQKDLAAGEAIHKEFRQHWAPIYAKLKEVDVKLATHIEDGAVELDHEFTKPKDQQRPWELTEEAVKLSRLLAEGAELLGVEVNSELVAADPSKNIPFNKEQRVEITLTDHKIEPAVITLEQHTKVTFVITNKGAEEHEFEIPHYAMEVEDLKPGETKEMTLVVLDSGDWEVACHLPGHYEVGMFGTLKVTPAELQTR